MALDYATIEVLAPVLVVGTIVATAGWVFNNWLRMRHGYPLENSWGKAVYPRNDEEAKARVAIITQENAQLRAEIGAMRERLETVERIVTDSGYSLTHEIESLRDRKDAH